MNHFFYFFIMLCIIPSMQGVKNSQLRSHERLVECQKHCSDEKNKLIKLTDHEDPYCITGDFKNCLTEKTVQEKYSACLEWCLNLKKKQLEGK